MDAPSLQEELRDWKRSRRDAFLKGQGIWGPLATAVGVFSLVAALFTPEASLFRGGLNAAGVLCTLAGLARYRRLLDRN